MHTSKHLKFKFSELRNCEFQSVMKLQYTGVIERPELQEIYIQSLPAGTLRNGDGVARYETNPDGHGVKAVTQSGAVHEGDVIIGADGIWSRNSVSLEK